MPCADAILHAELNAYVASPDLMGKPVTEQWVAPLVFKLQDFPYIGEKRKEQDWFAEMRKSCGQATF